MAPTAGQQKIKPLNREPLTHHIACKRSGKWKSLGRVGGAFYPFAGGVSFIRKFMKKNLITALFLLQSGA